MGVDEREQFQELAFFPSGKFIKAAVIGFDNLFADIYWMQSVQYVGGHFMTDRKFPLLYHIYDVVTELDPRFTDAYNFGAMILASFETKKGAAAVPSQTGIFNLLAPIVPAGKKHTAMDLLNLGMARSPDNWQVPFQAGFINYAMYHNDRLALHYFKMARAIPGHGKDVDRFIAFLNEKQGDLSASLKMWESMYEKTNVPLTKNVCVYNILRLGIAIKAKSIRAAIEHYKASVNRFPESLEALVRSGYIANTVSVVPWKQFGYKPGTGALAAPQVTWEDVGKYREMEEHTP